MNALYVLFARTLLNAADFGTTLYIWGIPGIGKRVRYCKVLCYYVRDEQEQAYAIVPHQDSYRWQVEGVTGKSATFAGAWAKLPVFLTYAEEYRDSQWVRVPHMGTTMLYRLWLAEHIAARQDPREEAPSVSLPFGDSTFTSDMLTAPLRIKRE